MPRYAGDMDTAEPIFRCSECGEKHANAYSHRAHGLCTACRDKAFDEARRTQRCPREFAQLRPFTPHSDGPRAVNRFLICPECGLVISADPADRVKSALELREAA